MCTHRTAAIEHLEFRLLMSRSASIHAGDPDASFGSGGRIVVDFETGSDSAETVAVQPDGKVVVTGSAGGALAVARYNVDGSPDASFGVRGVVTGAIADASGGRALAFGADGDIIGAGTGPGAPQE